jgi:hypothetical protein
METKLFITEDLMNEQPNTPMLPQPTGVSDWFSTWGEAITKPNEQTYAAMAARPEAQTNNRAFIWVFLAATVAAIISGVLSAILEAAGVATQQIPGLSDLVGSAPRSAIASLGIALCISPISGAIATLFFAIFVGVVQWVARMFGGTGTFSQLAYSLAAISVPVTLISSVLTPFSSIGAVGYCAGGLSLLLGLYALVLQLMAVKGVNRFGWGQALGSYFIPGVVICGICFCLIFGLASTLGLAFSDIFDQINQTIVP